MRGEQAINNETIINSDSNVKVSQASNRKKITGRVDINLLMSKVRQEEKKQKKESLFFFVLLGCVLILTGVIASL